METNELLYGTGKHHEAFSTLCEPLHDYLGTTDVAYFNVNKDASVTNIHSNYEWMKGYIAGKHYNLDPHMVHPDNVSEGFYVLAIKDLYQYQEYTDALLYETKNTLNYGFSYVTKTDLDFTAWFFTAANNKFINVLLNQSSIIKLLIQNLEHQMKSTFPELQQNKANLITLKGDLFFQQRGILFHE